MTATITAGRSLATFDPRMVWGAALDGHELSDAAAIYTRQNIAAMKTSGLGPITYRLRTELGIDAWHWNPTGTWSDPAHHQGYWVSDATSTGPIELSFGYRLPRRGRTVDDADNDGYSRIDDGDTTTFWKSNPYLDPRFTRDPEKQHPQWFTVDLGAPAPVQEIRFLWGAPFPRHVVIEYWSGEQTQAIDYNPDGEWKLFPRGTLADVRGGDESVVLDPVAVRTRFIRVTMTQSSHTAMSGNGDPRDSLGFALREVFAGDRDSTGIFRDRVHHDTIGTRQSAVLVSSTDPWHREIDRDDEIAQPGFDLVMRTGLAHGLPLLVPTGLLFDTPENAAAELRFLESRGYPLAGIELGEEPDGQRITPEDYAALYLQFAAALHQVDPGARLGGPSWQDLLDDPLELWPTRGAPGNRPTPIGRFLDYLDAHRRTADYRFFSFEWYPFDDVCADPADNLAAAPGMLTAALDRVRSAGLPESIPRIMTEYGYSAHLSLAEVTLPAALFDADVVARFFAEGGARSYYFGYEPGALAHERACPHWGNLIMFLADSAGQATYRMPRYWSAWLLTHAWADSAGGSHTLHGVELQRGAARVDDSLLTLAAMRRPDHRWSLLAINRDPRSARTIAVRVRDRSSAEDHSLGGPIDLWQYSAAQYQFHEDADHGRPVRDLPPAHEIRQTLESVTLPPYSITVVTGW
ncbi:MAG: discoidin domain-containing protein [Gemmatimonadales bacterium]